MALVEISHAGAVMTITLNRPDRLNALDGAMAAELTAALVRATDPEVRAVVITGAGRGFCAGQDLGRLEDHTPLDALLREHYHPIVVQLRELEKPVIASVNGPAAGAGLSLALACDVRIAGASASFVPAYGKIGLAPGAGATWILRRLLGPARAFTWLATGSKLSAADARLWGIVAAVVPDKKLASKTAEVAAEYAALPTRAVWELKRLLDAAETDTFASHLDDVARAQGELGRTRDYIEGRTAFAEGRPPEFDGKPPSN